ncbi:MAG TPA: nucleoside triphosphate pyrophosphohydrolase [Clostridiales bacterium]|jgi:tetrapyrrole methylase family protein / MazG family protein|nr:nucleoside triphosphate pyrophosphohydrolase [Clostridiales bacterium]HQP70375.1 nucleoside triphosphate pyrophosphohydrolase [Clostridiales bacterium]
MEQMQRLVNIMKKLRDKKEGCPWDLEQTHESLRKYILEEAYEVIEAIEDKDKSELKKELGDLLLQIIFQSQIASEKGEFDIEDVAKSISDKLELRHPHIFGEKKTLTPDQVKNNWEIIKKEKEGKKRILDGVPRSFNALLRSLRLQQKAGAVGFEWQNSVDILEKVKEEITELEEGIKKNDPENIEEELGDILFVMVNLAKKLNVNPEDALQKANNKFIGRFNYIEEKVERSGGKLQDRSLEELDAIWNESKRHVK